MAGSGEFRLLSSGPVPDSAVSRGVALRVAGFSFAEIADDGPSSRPLFPSEAAAEAAVSQAVKSDRELELARLDAIQRTFWDAAMEGDPTAAKIVLQVIAQRGRVPAETQGQPGTSKLQALRDERRA